MEEARERYLVAHRLMPIAYWHRSFNYLACLTSQVIETDSNQGCPLRLPVIMAGPTKLILVPQAPSRQCAPSPQLHVATELEPLQQSPTPIDWKPFTSPPQELLLQHLEPLTPDFNTSTPAFFDPRIPFLCHFPDPSPVSRLDSTFPTTELCSRPELRGTPSLIPHTRSSCCGKL